MNKLSKRKKIMLFSMLGLVLCLAVANQALNNQQSLTTSTEYTNYEKKEMQKHDGDVLVDSLNIKEVPASGGAIKTETSDSKVVTSDDVADLGDANTYFDELRATIDLDRNQGDFYAVGCHERKRQ